MLQNGTIEAAIALAERKWPGLELHRKNAHEASSSCPLCGQATRDGFLIFDDLGFWCRKCGQSGRLNRDTNHRLTSEELIEIRLRRLERLDAEKETRLQALERMAHCHDHEQYHDAAINSTTAMEWFISQGIQPWAVFDYKLGTCPRCPTDREGRPSYTFPIWRKDGPLWSIRHRLQGADSDKYRPHRRNLGRQLVNAQLLGDWSDRVIVVEGVKKARVIQQYDLPVVGILGKTGFEDRWLSWFHPSASICIALDPDAQECADKLAHRIAQHGKPVSIARFPMKPDDLFIAGATVDEWESYIHLARRIH